MKRKIKLIVIICLAVMFIGKINPLIGLSSNKNTYSTTQNIETSTYLMLVNKENPLGLKYEPKNLTKVNIDFLSDSADEEKYMDKEAAMSIEELFKTAKSEGINLIGTSAYRSYKTQVKIMNKNIKEKGLDYANNYVALPGKSEHQTGLAIDVTNEARCFDKTSLEAQWLANNAYRFGFILRYPEGKENITGYNYEPWHVRYVGKEAAKEIYDKNITLEEYLNKIG